MGAVSYCADKIGRHGVQPCPTADWAQLLEHTRINLTKKKVSLQYSRKPHSLGRGFLSWMGGKGDETQKAQNKANSGATIYRRHFLP
ncbi:MAG: hypothetical protein SLRJCFUN_000708 [Candidatus Fervidibacter sp.]